MRRRVLACLLAIAFLATGQSQSLTVQKLIGLVESQIKLIKEKKGTDQELARYLATVRVSEKLEASVVENLQADGAGPQTVNALKKMMEQSKGLQTAAVIPKPLPDIPIPIPTSIEQGQILDEVRDYVMNYDSTLPDFICLEIEQRAIAGGHGRPGTEPSYKPLDTISSKLTYFNHKEEKTPILNGSRPVHGDYESLGGATSRGDFETALRLLFDPATQAHFEWARWTKWRKKRTMVFSFRVTRDRSQYTIGTGDHKAERVTAYSGEVFVDNDPPHAVMRLKTKAEDIPVDFPIQRAETTLDYAYADIGGQQFLLPENGEVLMDGPDWTAKNDNRFQGYRKYEVGSAITYDLKDLAVPEQNLKETPATPPPVDCKDPKNKDLPACKK